MTLRINIGLRVLKVRPPFENIMRGRELTIQDRVWIQTWFPGWELAPFGNPMVGVFVIRREVKPDETPDEVRIKGIILVEIIVKDYPGIIKRDPEFDSVG